METKTIKIDEKAHKELKLYCVKNDLNMKSVVEELIKKLIENENMQ
jgi:hypothetical protein